jgi:hypothetical protein
MIPPFYFQNHRLFDQKIEAILAVKLNGFVGNRKRHLAFEGDVGDEQFMRKEFFLSGFEEPGAKRLMNFDCRTDDVLCYTIHYYLYSASSAPQRLILRIHFHQRFTRPA